MKQPNTKQAEAAMVTQTPQEPEFQFPTEEVTLPSKLRFIGSSLIVISKKKNV